MEVPIRKHDGTYRWHISRAVPIRNEQGQVSSWVGTASDIHDQKMFSEELEKKVQERTDLLKVSNIDLEHSNKNLEQFAFIASHDLQEPLRKIKTFSNILSDNYKESLPGEAKKLIDRIFTASERMSLLIQDVLDFSRIDNSAGHFVMTNLNDVFSNVITDFNLLIAEKKAVVTCAPLPVMEASPIQINQLFHNLISNSLKFTRPDVVPIIDVSVRTLSPADQSKYPEFNPKLTYCEILFSDNGIGFERKYAEKIFIIFQRLHSTQQFPGTGIGLALCKKIVVNHNGEIFARSDKTGGAQFHVILPLSQK